MTAFYAKDKKNIVKYSGLGIIYINKRAKNQMTETKKQLAVSDFRNKRRDVMEKKQPVKEKKKPAKKKKPAIIDVVEQAMFTSVGLALKTKDEVRKLARDFVKTAELSEGEGKKFIDDYLKRYDKSREKLEEKVEKVIKDVVNRSNLATKDELEEIKAEIKKLKKATAKK